MHRRHVIEFVADLFFPLWRAIKKISGFTAGIRRMRVDGSRIQKEKVANSKMSGGYVWTGPEKNIFEHAIACVKIVAECRVLEFVAIQDA